jgi:hypothetical protein
MVQLRRFARRAQLSDVYGVYRFLVDFIIGLGRRSKTTEARELETALDAIRRNNGWRR